MANPDHLQILKKGVDVWNEWREENPSVEPNLEGEKEKLNRIELPRINLSGTRLEEADLRYTNLSEANLHGACLTGADLYRTILCDADLTKAQLHEASLRETNLFKAKLNDANLSWAELTETDLRMANLDGANLTQAHFVNADLSGAILTNCRVYGISAWDLNLEETIQRDLIITDSGKSAITVDNLDVAQFVYLLLNNKKIRDVINAITVKVVFAHSDEIVHRFRFMPSTHSDSCRPLEELSGVGMMIIQHWTACVQRSASFSAIPPSE